MLGLLETVPTLRRGTDILPADDVTCRDRHRCNVDSQERQNLTKSKRTLIHLLLYGLEPVVGRSQTVTVWRKSGSGVGFDQRQRSLVLLPRDLQQELNREHRCRSRL